MRAALTGWCLSPSVFPTHLLRIACSLFRGYHTSRCVQGSFPPLLQDVPKYYLPWLPDLTSQPCQHLHPWLFLAASHIQQTRHYIYLTDSGLPRWNLSPTRTQICLICSQLCLQQLEWCPTHSRCSRSNSEWMETKSQNHRFSLQNWDHDT